MNHYLINFGVHDTNGKFIVHDWDHIFAESTEDALNAAELAAQALADATELELGPDTGRKLFFTSQTIL